MMPISTFQVRGRPTSRAGAQYLQLLEREKLPHGRPEVGPQARGARPGRRRFKSPGRRHWPPRKSSRTPAEAHAAGAARPRARRRAAPPPPDQAEVDDDRPPRCPSRPGGRSDGATVLEPWRRRTTSAAYSASFRSGPCRGEAVGARAVTQARVRPGLRCKFSIPQTRSDSPATTDRESLAHPGIVDGMVQQVHAQSRSRQSNGSRSGPVTGGNVVTGPPRWWHFAANLADNRMGQAVGPRCHIGCLPIGLDAKRSAQDSNPPRTGVLGYGDEPAGRRFGEVPQARNRLPSREAATARTNAHMQTGTPTTMAKGAR